MKDIIPEESRQIIVFGMHVPFHMFFVPVFTQDSLNKVECPFPDETGYGKY